MSDTSKHVTYEDAGVDTAEGARAVDAIKQMVKETNRPEVIGGIGGFGGLFSASALKDMEDPILISGTDGVGTKLVLAQLLGRHETVGQDLVAMCVNDILASGAEPLFFLDYIAIGKLRKEHVAGVVGGIADGCRQAGCALVGGEMAEHPGVMDPDDYDLSGFCVGVVDRPKMIGPDNVTCGDVVVGLRSSGFHSNGYSLVRKVMVEGKTAEDLAKTDERLGGKTIGEALIEPTRIYVKPVLSCLRELPGAVHALAHITGGGMTENLNRALPKNLDALVDPAKWDVPGITQMAVEAAGLSDEEALKTFNMGIGMALIVDASQVEAVIENLKAAGENPCVIGSIIEGTGCVRYPA